MSEIKSESVSSLVDNYTPSIDESISSHLVDSMLKDEELSTTWQNYHLIGDVLRDETPQALQLDLSDKISAAIAQEATILSPNSATKNSINTNTTEDASQVINDTVSETNRVIDASNRFKAKISGLIKPMGQVAIAASAAVLMIVGVQHNVADNNLPVTQNQVVQTLPLAGYANPVSFNIRSVQPTQNEQTNLQSQRSIDEQVAEDRVAQQRRLQALLQDHNHQVKLGNNIK